MFSALTQGAVLMLALGQSLSNERAFNEPVIWGSGANPTFVAAPSGLVVVTVDQPVAFARVVANDGTLRSKVNLGSVTPGTALAMTTTSRGVLIAGESINPTVSWTQLLDPRTAQLLTPRHVLDGGLSGPFFFGGVPGQWQFLVYQQQLEAWVSRLTVDGEFLGSPARVSFAAVVEARGTYAVANEVQPDGGRQAQVISIQPAGLDSVTTAPISTLRGVATAIAPTSDGVAVIVVDTRDQVVVFLDPTGTELGRTTIGRDAFNSVAETSDSGEVWVASSEGVSMPSAISVVRLSRDGGSVRSELVGADAGLERVPRGLVIDGAALRVLFTTRYATRGYGRWQETSVLPAAIDSNGASVAGTPVSIFPLPSAQLTPSFSSRQRVRPLAVGWNDDQQLPREYQLVAMRLDSTGAPSGPPTALEPLRPDFTTPLTTGRFLSTTGQSFMALAYNGFFVRPIEWSFDGGLAQRDDLTGLGIHSAPVLTPLGTGYGVTFSDYNTWRTRLVDASGRALTSSVTQPGEVLDVWDELHLVRRNETMSLTRVVGTTAPRAQLLISDDAGITNARFAVAGSTLLLAWSTLRDAGVARVSSKRFTLEGDGGVAALDAEALSFQVAASNDRALHDIGVRDGVFHLLGVERVDGGDRGWLYRRSADGGSVDERPLDIGLGFVSALTAGPQVDDGSLLIAYTRPIADGPRLSRGYLRTIGDIVDAGPDDAGTREDPPVSQATLVPYQVCGCNMPGRSWGLLVLAAIARRVRRRS